MQLLLRTTRHVSLTSAGAVYAARVEPVVEAFEAVADEVRAETGHAAGLIRLNVPLSLGQRILPDVVSGFRVEIRVSRCLYFDGPVHRYRVRIVSISPSAFQSPPSGARSAPCVVCSWRLRLRPTERRNRPMISDEAACIAYDEEALSETWELAGRAR